MTKGKTDEVVMEVSCFDITAIHLPETYHDLSQGSRWPKYNQLMNKIRSRDIGIKAIKKG